MIMAAVYLLYSAYFLSIDFDSIYDIMSVLIAVLYAGLALSFTISNIKNKRKIKSYLAVLVEGQEENVMNQSLLIKI